ncbi:MAG: BON domain-containing protein [Proteobacteria bacterium]|nr:BON domain-containing protein [Pseudomonadota bacterium]
MRKRCDSNGPFRIAGATAMAGIVILGLTLSGCVSLAIGAGATVGTAAMQERGLGGAIDDTVINGKMAAAFIEHDISLRDISIEVHEGEVMLTGTVPKIADRVDAVRQAWHIEGVKTVINEIQIADSSDIVDIARDTWVSAQLRLRLTFDGKVRAINYAVDTVNGTVYLMGIAQSEAELERVQDHARELKYVRRIISHVRIKTPETVG